MNQSPAPVPEKVFRIAVNTANVTGIINPLLFGCNCALPGVERFAAYRLGGNRMTGLNWKNNMSNAGHDYFHVNDGYMARSLKPQQAGMPGALLEDFHERSAAQKAYDVITLPMAGYVSADGDGTVTRQETAPSPRWLPVTCQPGRNERHGQAIDIDECIDHLLRKFGRADEGGVKAYMLDNEPALWPGTHPRIHPAKTTCRELMEKSIALSTVIKKKDALAEVFGWAAFGFSELLHFHHAPDYRENDPGGTYRWFLDAYLDEMRKASEAAGTRLLDVLDIHWYSEARGVARVIENGALDALSVSARVNATRTLWQEGYCENSWISRDHGAFLPLLPNILCSIDRFFPGTKLSFSEFNFGGENHISGAMAIIDFLMVLAKHGAYAAFFWPMTEDVPYCAAAYNLLLNADRKGLAFGSRMVELNIEDEKSLSAYAALPAESDHLHLLCLNKSNEMRPLMMAVEGTAYSSARVFLLDGSGPSIQRRDAMMFSDSMLALELPPFSIVHAVCER